VIDPIPIGLFRAKYKNKMEGFIFLLTLGKMAFQIGDVLQAMQPLHRPLYGYKVMREEWKFND
jgi:hypothetical protein